MAGFHQTRHSAHAIIDVHEGSRLLAISPDLYLVIPRVGRLDDLAAESSRRLLAPSDPGPEGAVDVVKAEDPHVEAKVLVKIPAHALREEFLPPIPIFRLRGIGVRLLEGHHVGVVLPVVRVNAGTTRVKEALHAQVAGPHQKMGID